MDAACFDPSVLNPFNVSKSVAASVRAAILTDPVRNGFYWWIPLLNAITSDATAQAFDVYLVEPGADINLSPATPATQGRTHKIAPSQGDGSGAAVSFSSSSGRAAALPNQLPEIIVPAGWRLLLIEANAAIPVAARTIQLRFLYAEIKNGEPPPF